MTPTQPAVETPKQFTTPFKRSINAIVSDLHKPIHPRHLKQKKRGGAVLTFISWFDAASYLDLYAPGWCYEIRSLQHVADKVVVTVRLSITADEGVFYREATGIDDEDTESFGDFASNATSMALRRAAVMFGLGKHLYQK